MDCNRFERWVARVLLVAFLLQCLPLAVWAKEPERFDRVQQEQRKRTLRALELAGMKPSAYIPEVDIPTVEATGLEPSLRPSASMARLSGAPMPSADSDEDLDLDFEMPEPGPALLDSFEAPKPEVLAQEPPPEPEPELTPDERRAKNQMAIIVPQDDEIVPPPYRWARVTHPFAGYEDISAGKQIYANDMLLQVSRWYSGIANPGETKIRWDFVSPVAEHNRTSHNSSASIEFHYTSAGASPSAFDAEYELRMTVWDRKNPEGKLLNRKEKNPTQLTTLSLFAGVTPRDVGTWTMKEVRDGSEIASETFEVLAMPEAPAELSRFTNGAFQAESPFEAVFLSDDWLVQKKSYTLADIAAEDNPPNPDPMPDDDMTQTATVLWHFDSPRTEDNVNKFGSYLSYEFYYKQNAAGTKYTLRTKVWDPIYKNGGRITRFERVEGTLPEIFEMQYGMGLPSPGDWTLREVINGVESPSATVEARELAVGVDNLPFVLKDNASSPTT